MMLSNVKYLQDKSGMHDHTALNAISIAMSP